jgi:hypothetical protein
MSVFSRRCRALHHCHSTHDPNHGAAVCPPRQPSVAKADDITLLKRLLARCPSVIFSKVALRTLQLHAAFHSTNHRAELDSLLVGMHRLKGDELVAGVEINSSLARCSRGEDSVRL